MKIIECSPFFNENLVANIHIEESMKWVDQFHITESNYSFKMGKKDFNFTPEQQYPNLYYHKMDVANLYKENRRFIPYIDFSPVTKWHPKIYRNTAWLNEAIQRNYTLWNADISDEDIVILSDIDEIIDSNNADIIVDAVKKKGIVTIKLHFSIFYFNLFCQQWGGPKEYSYRIFVVKGNILKKVFFNDSDCLRKLGERGQLEQDVYCFPDKMGFHHSWIGDEFFVLNKLKSYAHSYNDHSSAIIENGDYSIGALRKCIAYGESIFPGTELIVDDSIKLLDSIMEIQASNPQLFYNNI